MQTLTTDVHRFGDVTTFITPCDITLVPRKDQLAQMMVADGLSKYISDICLKLKHNVTTVGNQITGCSILTGVKMIFIKYDPVYLLILNADGSTIVCNGCCMYRPEHNLLMLTPEKP